MRAIDQILERTGPPARQNLQVPEWDLEVWWAPVTADDLRAVGAQKPVDQHQLAVYLLIRKAEDSDGNRLFSISDTHALLTRVDIAPIALVSLAMMQDLADLVPDDLVPSGLAATVPDGLVPSAPEISPEKEPE